VAPVTTPRGEIIAVRAPGVERWSWALYDFANTIFSMNVVSLFFAVWMISDLGASNTSVALATGLTSVLVALSVPILGAISDARQRRKPWIVAFTLLAVAATAAIGVAGYAMAPPVGDALIGGGPPGSQPIPRSALLIILGAYVLANYMYQAAMPFYNAMLPELAPPGELGRLSGMGAAIGYVGSIVGVMLVTPFFNGALPVFGELSEGLVNGLRSIVPFTGRGGRVSTFVPTALLFLLFSLPLFVFCHDHKPRPQAPIRVRQAFADVVAAIRETRRYPGALRFLITSFLYQDAMGTIIMYMALYAVEAVGFREGIETTLFVVLTLPAVVGSYLWGKLVDRVGPKKALTAVLLSWLLLLTALIFVPSVTAFWIIGAGIGLIYGGIATAERPLLLTLVPDVESGRFFGLMVLSARTAAITGPLAWSIVVDQLRPAMGPGFAYRAAVGTVILSFGLALYVLRKVPDNFRLATDNGRQAPSSQY
jgi:UMF1 family MFS transporter